MSYFNLTQLGYDNKYRSLEPINSNRLPRIANTNKFQSSLQKQLARDITGNIQSREWSTPAISNSNYHTLRSMHVRGNQNPNEISRRSLTESQEIGWWTKDEPLKTNEPWTRQKRYVHGQSEMTKFVDVMKLGNPYFQFY